MIIKMRFTQGSVHLLWLIAVVSAQTPSSSLFSNSTSTSTVAVSPTPTPSACCFVFIDQITEIWAELYSTSIFYDVVNVTSYTIRVTPGPNTTQTNIETNIYTTNATFTTSFADGDNPLTLFDNQAPMPNQTVATVYNQSQIVTHGVTLTSPQAAYVYSTVKIRTAAAVTDTNGNLACGTAYVQTENNFKHQRECSSRLLWHQHSGHLKQYRWP
ncbi:hypothetical protein B0O99DRAFT_376923 [Bisporella sp. PMI_857]|nr:hypothetical protein B0O99DRAFT_376923 [Bisporella sp. PMI_857]